GPDTHPFPAPWPFEERRAHSATECPVRPGSRAGRVVGRFLLPGAPRWGRVDWGGGFGTEPVTLGQLRAEPVQSPTHPRRAAGVPTAVPKRAGTAGVPSKRPAAGAMPRTPDPDSWSTDNGLSSHGLAPSAPVRRRLAGRAVAQWRTKRWTSKTAL